MSIMACGLGVDCSDLSCAAGAMGGCRGREGREEDKIKELSHFS